MESSRINASNQNDALRSSALLAKRPKSEPNAPKFMQVLAEAVETTTSKTIKAELANLARLVKPRSHMQLTSLNPVQTSYTPEAAALERIGKWRILPFSIS
ncbi:hypothetical protein ACI2KS_04025 [Pseudomonas sp. NPDC087358]|uniref:hypothetical protein n=1 Tax=Pseudomonas sp. NPDC087358 TaxID=3364439 RepID=UPI003850FFC4